MMTEAMEAASDALDVQLWENDYALSQYDYGGRRRKPILQAIAARVVAVYLSEAKRLRPISEAPPCEDLLFLWDAGKDGLVFMSGQVSSSGKAYAWDHDELATPPLGWLPLPELPGQPALHHPRGVTATAEQSPAA